MISQPPFTPDDCVHDPGIAAVVQLLQAHDIATYESCQGGEGHAFVEPTVRFHGNVAEGWKALGILLFHALPVRELRRRWHLLDGEVVGPEWEVTFNHREEDRP